MKIITISKKCNCGSCGKEFDCDELTPISDGLALCQLCYDDWKNGN